CEHRRPRDQRELELALDLERDDDAEEGRATAETMRNEMVEQTRKQQTEMIENARKTIEAEQASAIAALRREAVGLALAGAGKLIGQKLDAAADRQLVEQYLTTLRSN
ncbi:MAG: hypothetical protein ACKOH8_06535, partial [Gemmatimonadota bacterium]